MRRLRPRAANSRHLESLDRSLDGFSARIDALVSQADARREYLLQHRGDRDRLRLVLRAEQARSLQVAVNERTPHTPEEKFPGLPASTGSGTSAAEITDIAPLGP